MLFFVYKYDRME